MTKAFKKYVCPRCGVEHYVGTGLELNDVNCGNCDNGVINEENFKQVEIYDGKVEQDKKPVKTFHTVQEYRND